MSDTRKGEASRPHFRSDRCIVVNGGWYVATREGIDVGPYPTKIDAEAIALQLEALLADCEDLSLAIAIVKEFVRRRNS